MLAGDAGAMGEAEQSKLEEKGLLGQFRLAGQVRVSGDLKVRPAMTVATSGMEAGPRPAE